MSSLFLNVNALSLPLPDKSVHTCVTSPPYWSLRDYGVDDTEWPDGSTGCLGLESTPEEYINHLVMIFREVKRVLRDDGTCWIVIGDNYAVDFGGGTGRKAGVVDCALDKEPKPARHLPTGVKAKDMMCVPWLLGLALRADGWYLRSDIIWYKSNAMPEPVYDRPTKSHEYVLLLSKNPKYYYDIHAMKEPWETPWTLKNGDGIQLGSCKEVPIPFGRHKKTVWSIPTTPTRWDFCSNCNTVYLGPERALLRRSAALTNTDQVVCPTCKSTEYWLKHFAIFPPELAKMCIEAGTSEQVCSKCGTPFARVTEPTKKEGLWWLETTGWLQKCSCPAYTPDMAVVLDPFGGAGTTARMANSLGRDFEYADIKPEFTRMAAALLAKDVEK
jgi:DNA modification methylase